MGTGASTPIVFVGAATLDTIASVDRLPTPDERLVADDVATAGGGPAATAAVAAARLGAPAALVGVVGDDADGPRVRDGLAAEGVDVTGLATVPGTRTGRSVVLVEATAGTRAICTRPGPPLAALARDPSAADRAAALLGEADWVHADHLGWPALTRLRPSRTARVSLDAGNPVPGLDLAAVHVYAPTADGLRRDATRLLPGPTADAGLRELARAALRAGADTVVVTLGGDGSLATDARGVEVRVPGRVVEVRSTLGAGDVFHGALVAALAHGTPLAQACAYANVAAALSCRGLDGRSTVPDHDAVQALLARSAT